MAFDTVKFIRKRRFFRKFLYIEKKYYLCKIKILVNLIKNKIIMGNVDYTGIKKEGAETIVSALSNLLADFQIFYANMRGFHWNIKGKSFFLLHEKFENQYDYLAEKVDEVAERILMLGGTPENNYSQYLKVAAIKEVSGVCCETEILNSILDSYKTIIAKERAIIELAGKYHDEATISLLSGYIEGQEKTIWMFNAFLATACKDSK
jgi:starvation-inducible DNA-binding protein